MDLWWQRAFEAVGQDFADLNDPAQFARLLIRLVLVVLLGGVIGFERQRAGKAAGVRTHMLVAVGVAVFVTVAQQSGMNPPAMSRVVQGLIAGIGFLGAGTILKLADEGEIHGLTTAASIWVTAAIGLAVGMGRDATAILSTAVVWAILAVVPRLERIIDKRRR